ncbi:MAG: trigger factor [Planctomycetes bacterium]|nr:trigger factor [Planctomycetota bacterium]MCB9918317.1 trigger factor [Planctomycetota bacterium]
MNVEFLDSGPNRKTMKVAVPPERIRDHVAKVFRAANQQVRLKGFRPGKIPPKVLREKLGDSILAEAKESIINETFQEAMKGQELDIVGTPRLEVSTGPLDETQPLEYSVDFDLRPKVEVGDVAAITIEKKPTAASDEDLQSSLDHLAQQKRKLGPVDDVVGEGDFVKVNVTYKHDGNEVARKEGLQLNSGIPIRGTDAEEFKNKLLEQKKGATVVVPITYPDSFEKEEVRGKSGDVELEILDVIRFAAPPLDDDFAKGFEFESMDAMRNELREKISEQKERMETARIEEEILEKLYEQKPFDLPQGLVEAEAAARAKAWAEDMKKQKVAEAEAKRAIEEAKGDLEKAARTGVRNLFLVEAIAMKNKLFVTETDIENDFKRIASENDASLDEVRKYVEDNKLLGEVRLQLVNGKVREYLRKTAKMVDSKDSGAGESGGATES